MYVCQGSRATEYLPLGRVEVVCVAVTLGGGCETVGRGS